MLRRRAIDPDPAQTRFGDLKIREFRCLSSDKKQEQYIFIDDKSSNPERWLKSL